MALIKSTNTKRLIKDAIVLDIGDLHRQAGHIVSDARARAAKVLADAQAEAKRLISAADARGYAEGLQRGVNEGHQQGQQQGHADAIEQSAAQLSKILESWTTALENWERDRAAMLESAREDVLRFAFALGERIVCRAIAHDPAIVKDQLNAALHMLSRPTSIFIAVNPEDRPLIDQVLPQLMAMFSQCKDVELVDDPALKRGGCVVKSRGGQIDASIETQLNRIAEALLPDQRNLLPPSTSEGSGE